MDSVYSINIERAVLSSILFNNEEFDDVAAVLKPVDFYLPAHAKIFEAMVKLVEKDYPIDDEFIRRTVDSKEVDDSVMIEILSASAISNTKAYIKEIKDGSTKRQLTSLATTIKKVAIEEDMSADDAVATVGRELDKISDDSIGYNFLETSLAVMEFDIEFRASKDNLKGFSTGIDALDREGVRYEPGDLVVIGARPSIGKTSLANTAIGNYIFKHNIGVLFDSLEMPVNKILRSLIAVINEESKSDLKNGVVRDPNRYNQTIQNLKNTPNLTIHDKGYLPVQYYLAKARKIFRKNPHYKIWMIDHLKFIKSKGDKRHYEVGVITKSLKAFAKEFGIVVVLFSQLARPTSTSVIPRPSMTALRESGDVEEDADIIILPHREDYYKRNQRDHKESVVTNGELIIEKYREGESKIVKTQFHGPYGKWGSFPMVEIEYQSSDSNSDNDIKM